MNRSPYNLLVSADASIRPKIGRKSLVMSVSLMVVVAVGGLSPMRRFFFDPPSQTDQTIDVYRRPSTCALDAREKAVRPTFVASYPGSGAHLTYKLVQGLTGMVTGADFDADGRVSAGTAVTIKTHCPAQSCSSCEAVKIEKGINRAILLLRNPLHSIPSMHSYVYESNHNMKVHSVRAPAEEWIKWRDAKLSNELKRWEKLVRYWVENYEATGEERLRLDVLFEKLTSDDPEVGAAESKRIVDFLHEGDDRVRILTDEGIKCVWETIKEDHPALAEHKSLREGPEVRYLFTSDQLREMQEMLQRLAEWRPEQLGRIMTDYRDVIIEEA